jgi:carbamoyl-phosphate synthase large subunit
LRVLATDCDPAMSSACQSADLAFAVPRCADPDFIPRLLEISVTESVDLIIPTIDSELLPLAEARLRFEAIGTRVAVSDPETVAMARNKLATADFLVRHGISSPRSKPLAALIADPGALRFPVMLKIIDGSSSIGLREAVRIDEVFDPRLDHARYLAQEKWVGEEYTVNLFFDHSGRCRATVPHRRCAVRAGEVSKGVTVRHPVLADFAARLAHALPGARGALCFQSIITPDGDGVVFEINARFGGGYPLSHRAGARFSRWILEEVAGLPCSAHDDWEELLMMLRYDAAVFVTGVRK